MNTPDQLEKAITKSLHRKATNYVDDNVPPPPFVARQPQTLNQRNQRFSPQKLSTIAIAASLASVMAVGFGAVVLERSQNTVRTQVTKPAPPAGTPGQGNGKGTPGGTATGKSDPSAAPESGEAKQNQVTGFPKSVYTTTHMTKTHQGPALVVNFPFYCGSDQIEHLVPRPVDPIKYCQDKGYHKGIEHDKLSVETHSDHVYVGRKVSHATDPEEILRARWRDLKDGYTYTGADIEVAYASEPTGLCETKDVLAATKSLLTKLERSEWRVVEVPHHGSAFYRCAHTRVEVSSRTVAVMAKKPGHVAPKPTTDSAEKDKESHHDVPLQHNREIRNRINSACLSGAEATKIATQEATRRGIAPSATPPKGFMEAHWNTKAVRHTIPNGRKCARIYNYSEGGLSYVVFGD